MKLAEALILRADSQRRLQALRSRLVRNAKVQEGDEPAERPEALLAELRQTAARLESLIQRINRTNSGTALSSEGGSSATLADALATRDVLKLQHAVFKDLAEAGTVSHARTTKSEVKFKSTVDVAATQAEADALAKQHRELDARIQEANWRVELMD